jgi:hypothetical protein
MSKRPKIEEELQKKIQDYANKYFDGNFTAAINKLVKMGLYNEACTK